LKFTDCQIPLKACLGVPGEGLKIALSSLDSGRLGIAAQSLGIAEAAFEAALAFAKKRHQFGHAIGENQSQAFKLADMRVKLDAGKLLMLHAAWSKDQGVPYGMAAAEAKLYCSEMCNEVAGEALQMHGGYGYIKDYPVEKYFRDARVTTIYEGTSEIQRIVISRQIFSPQSPED
jgi:alkylation response protein AidB-like acyl-CoA dehydrogenase